MSKALNRQTGQVEEVPDIGAAMASDAYLPLPSQEYLVRGSGGRLRSIKGSDMAAAIGKGYELLSDADGVQAARADKYGDSEGSAAAAAVARGLTFGLSDLALTKSGAVSPETLSGLREFNPTVSTVGELTGAAVPTLFTGGAGGVAAAGGRGAAAAGGRSLAARAAGALPTGALSAATRGIAGSVEGALAGSLSSTAIRRGIGAGVGSAIEGAAYGTGAAITEAALGDPEVTAQSIIASAGIGALFGGAVGGAVGGIEGKLADRALRRSAGKQAAEDAASKAAQTADELAQPVATAEAATVREGVGDVAAAAEARLDGATAPMSGSPADAPGVSPLMDAAQPVADNEAAAKVLEDLISKSSGQEIPQGFGKLVMGKLLDTKVVGGALDLAADNANIPRDVFRELITTAQGRQASLEGTVARQTSTRQAVGAADKLEAVLIDVMDASRGEAKKASMAVKVTDTPDAAAIQTDAVRTALDQTRRRLANIEGAEKAYAYGKQADVKKLLGYIDDFGRTHGIIETAEESAAAALDDVSDIVIPDAPKLPRARKTKPSRPARALSPTEQAQIEKQKLESIAAKQAKLDEIDAKENAANARLTAFGRKPNQTTKEALAEREKIAQQIKSERAKMAQDAADEAEFNALVAQEARDEAIAKQAAQREAKAIARAQKKQAAAQARLESPGYGSRLNGDSDDFKRLIGRLAQFGNPKSDAEAKTQEIFKAIYKDIWMPMLENESVWGKAAADAQREVNAAWVPLLQRRRLIQQDFFKAVEQGEDRMRYQANPKSFDGYMRSLGDASNDLQETQVNHYFESGEQFLLAAKKHYNMSDELISRVDDALTASKDFNSARGKQRNQILMANAMAALRENSAWVARTHVVTIAAERTYNAVKKSLDDGFKSLLNQGDAQVRATKAGAQYVADRAEDTAARSTEAVLKQGERSMRQTSSIGERIVGAVKEGGRAAGRGAVQAAEREASRPTSGSRGADGLKRLRSSAVYGAEKALFESLGSVDMDEPSQASRDAQGALFRRQAARLSALTSNPDAMATRMAQNMGDMGLHAPETAAAVQRTAAAGLQFLQGKIPKNPYSQLPSALQRPWSPAPTEIAKFSRYVQAVAQPMSIVADLKAGRLSREGVEAVQAVYPKLHAQMIDSMTGAIAAATQPVPYPQRVQLSALMGVPLDVSMRPGYLAMVAKASGPPVQQELSGKSPVKMRQGGLEDSEKSDRMATASDNIRESV